MVNFWKLVDSVLVQADIILMVVDARVIAQTRNKEIEKKVATSGKTLITVINKCDLVEKEMLDRYKRRLHPCVFVSAHKFYGMTLLRKMILKYSRGEAVTVGVVGYPNTGKSSIINALKGKASAGVSSVSGYTKGNQNIRIDNKIRVIDTPGVLSMTDEKGSAKLIITASKTDSKYPDLAVYELLKNYRKELLSHYKIDDQKQTGEEILELIAIKLNRVRSGGVPDTETTAKKILQDWQRGKIQL